MTPKFLKALCISAAFLIPVSQASASSKIFSPVKSWGSQNVLSDSADCKVYNTYEDEIGFTIVGKHKYIHELQFQLGADFKYSKEHDVHLSVPPSLSNKLDAKHVRYTNGVLRILASAQTDMYDVLRSGQILYVKIDEKSYGFSLSGIQIALHKLSSCSKSNLHQSASFYDVENNKKTNSNHKNVKIKLFPMADTTNAPEVLAHRKPVSLVPAESTSSVDVEKAPIDVVEVVEEADVQPVKVVEPIVVKKKIKIQKKTQADNTKPAEVNKEEIVWNQPKRLVEGKVHKPVKVVIKDQKAKVDEPDPQDGVVRAQDLAAKQIAAQRQEEIDRLRLEHQLQIEQQQAEIKALRIEHAEVQQSADDKLMAQDVILKEKETQIAMLQKEMDVLAGQQSVEIESVKKDADNQILEQKIALEEAKRQLEIERDTQKSLKKEALALAASQKAEIEKIQKETQAEIVSQSSEIQKLRDEVSTMTQQVHVQDKVAKQAAEIQKLRDAVKNIPMQNAAQEKIIEQNTEIQALRAAIEKISVQKETQDTILRQESEIQKLRDSVRTLSEKEAEYTKIAQQKQEIEMLKQVIEQNSRSNEQKLQEAQIRIMQQQDELQSVKSQSEDMQREFEEFQRLATAQITKSRHLLDHGVPPQLQSHNQTHNQVVDASVGAAPVESVQQVEAISVYDPQAIEGGEVIDLMQPKWRAIQGSSLREVIAMWSLDEGAELIWDTDRQFNVLENYTTQDGFDRAIGTLLDQYKDNPAISSRPIGQLFIDPDTGNKVLVIREDNS